MNKIKFLKFDSVCLIAVYPSTVIVEHNYEICGGKCRYMARARVPTEGLYQASFFFPSPRRQQPPNPLIRRLLNILFYNYKKKIGSNYNFVKIDTGNGRYKKISLHITVRIQRSAAYSTYYSESEEVFILYQM